MQIGALGHSSGEIVIAKLNGWRRLWIVWAVLSLPLVMFTVERFLTPFSEYEYWIQADLDARLEVGRTVADEQLRRAAMDRVEAEYREKERRALSNGRRDFWLEVLIVWALLVGVTYGAGSTVAWVSRGFNREQS